MPVITSADLKRFAPHAAPRIAAALITNGDVAFARWDITTAARLRMFLAQAKVESGGFTVLLENMSYSAARIQAVWPSRFPTLASAQRFARNPEALADKVYGSRMGNRPGTDDGWQNRGQGLLDTTGRANLTALAAHMGLSVDETRARLTSDDGMVECAAATFHMLGCLPFADRGDVIGCTKRVNGGLIGLSDRRASFALASAVWPEMPELHAAPVPHPAAPPPAPVAPVPARKPALRTAPPKPRAWSFFDWIASLFGIAPA